MRSESERRWLARAAGSYELDGPPLLVSIISAAMPNLEGGAFSNAPRAGSAAWKDTVRKRIRAVLHAAKAEGCETLILGAFGCGAFGNPPEAVAQIFKHCLKSDEFRGCFRIVLFAILEARAADNGNCAAFADALVSLC